MLMVIRLERNPVLTVLPLKRNPEPMIIPLKRNPVPTIIPLKRNDERVVAEHDRCGQFIVIDIGAHAGQLVGEP